MKTLLFTGGAGFIGSHAISHFLDKYDNYNIINVDKLTYAASYENMSLFFEDPRHIFVKGDICDKPLVEKLFAENEVAGVIHFAAESHVDNSIHEPGIFIQTNVVGTYTLLEVARKNWQTVGIKNRFLHISTDEVYGCLGSQGSFTESSPYAPNSPYSASKASSDHLVRSYFKTYGLNTVITNCSNNFGPHQHAEKLVPTIIRNALENKPIPIYGSGENVRDWLYVSDHCEAIDLVFHQAHPGDQYNIGGNNERSNLDMAFFICRELDRLKPKADGERYEDLIQHVADRLGHDFRYAVDSDKIRQRLHWVPSMSLEHGLISTLSHYMKKYEKIV
jgi:dTDP-glucose 4,6-dehydratase